MRRWHLWASMLVSCLIATSCSLSRFGYDLAPSLLVWRIESYVTIDDAQRDLLTRHIDALHVWHRNNELTRYARLLREVDDGMRLAVDARTVGRWRAEVMGWWPTLAQHMAPGLVAFARSLRPEQIAEIKQRWRRAEDDFRGEFMPEGEKALVDARFERIRKRAEFFLGDLSRTQLASARELAQALPPTEKVWLAERARRGRAVIALVESIASRAESGEDALARARQVLHDIWSKPDPANAPALDAATSAADAVYAKLLNSATPAQRAEMHRRIAEWIRLAQSLAARQ